MTNKQINTFYTTTKEDQRAEYLQNVTNNIKELGKKLDRVSLYLILIIAVYYLLQLSIIDVTTIQYVTLKNNSVLPVILAVLFSHFFLQLILIQQAKTHLVKFSSELCFIHYKLPSIGTRDQVDTNPFVLAFLPYSFWNNLRRITGRKSTIADLILILPMLLVYFFPFVFMWQYYQDLLNLWPVNFFNKLGITTCVWFNLSTFYLIGKTAFLTISDNKQNDFTDIINQLEKL